MEKRMILGIPFDNTTTGEAVETAVSLVTSSSAECGVSVVVTPNAEIAYEAWQNDFLMALLKMASLILPDGAGIIKAAKILKTPLKGKVAGVEFGEALLQKAATLGLPVYFLGGKPGVASLAAEKMTAKYSSLSIAGVHDGYFEKNGPENDAVIDAINASGAVILFVCLGSPLQEKWIFANREKLTSVRLAACLGGSLDVYSGIVKRAPRLFIQLNLEWLWRLLQEPKRLPRMMRLPSYIRLARKKAKKHRR